MRRGALAASVALVGLLPAGARAEEPRALYRASAMSTAVHGFYDHEGLFPVPILNVSIPYTDATYEPGPTTGSLGSFLWNPQAAELGTIVCVLSEERLCEIPEYPFQARATYPAAGRPDSPPTLSIDAPGAPLRVRAAHEDAEAGPLGAASEADVAGFAAVPMNAPQAAAARAFAMAAEPFARDRVEVEPWLISIGEATSRSRTRADTERAFAASTAVLHDVALLGGIIDLEVVRGTAIAAVGRSARARAESLATGVSVAGIDARLTPHGIEVADTAVPAEAARILQDALETALRSAGFDLVAGREHARHSEGGARAEAFAVSLAFSRRALPEQLPEGTQGRDVLSIPLGFATAEAGVAQIVPPPPSAPVAQDPVTGGGGAVGVPGGVDVGGTGDLPVSPLAPAPEAAAPAGTAGPALALSDLGVSTRALVAALAAAVLFALALSWLRVNEALHEEGLRE